MFSVIVIYVYKVTIKACAYSKRYEHAIVGFSLVEQEESMDFSFPWYKQLVVIIMILVNTNPGIFYKLNQVVILPL